MNPWGSVILITDTGERPVHNEGLVSLYISGAAAGFWPAAAFFWEPCLGLSVSTMGENT